MFSFISLHEQYGAEGVKRGHGNGGGHLNHHYVQPEKMRHVPLTSACISPQRGTNCSHMYIYDTLPRYNWMILMPKLSVTSLIGIRNRHTHIKEFSCQGATEGVNRYEYILSFDHMRWAIGFADSIFFSFSENLSLIMRQRWKRITRWGKWISLLPS